MIKGWCRKKSHKIISSHSFIDPWFPFKYSLNIFSGCEYSCLYCRANWRQEKKVIAKENILDLITQEINFFKIPKNFLIGIGGGINETFSFDIKKNQIAYEVIFSLLSHHLQPVIITKNLLPILEIKNKFLNYPQKIWPIFIFSYSGLRKEKKNFLESDVPEVNFELIKKLKLFGFRVGVLFSPIIPQVNDQLNELRDIFFIFSQLKIDFILFDFIDFSGLNFLAQRFPQQFFQFNINDDFLDSPDQYKYYCNRIGLKIQKILLEFKIPLRMPQEFFLKKIPFRDEVVVLLYNIYFYKKLLNKSPHSYKSFYYAARFISQLELADWTVKLENKKLKEIKGIGEVISQFIYSIKWNQDYSYFDKIVQQLNK